ncbi:MAG: FixH family protein [Pseudomonadota bacterium]|jgi:nitrogen fixation protein FixH|nr:FixH protein [Rhodovulum sp. NI22]MDY6858154.1 FixH family protein [Pseudomonadota bacterium]|tara:strand:+ start:531 stop:989 length:459 start_codon:yes stop_codon:yes gene_type:complete
MTDKPLTGRTVLIITVSAFSVIIGVNLVMAFLAVDTFPGLEVKNSYVASQEFDTRRDAQEGLGWVVDSGYAEGELMLNFRQANGGTVVPRDFTVLIGRTTEARDDIRPEFTGYAGRYTAPVTLGRGKWMMLLEATAEDGTPFRQRLDLFVKG